MSFSSTSEDDASVMQTVVMPVHQVTSRRTRKRFTNVQLTMLENLFHQNSHPSREDREAVAKAGGMEIKSVTIWFQNKRQTERKSAASNNGQTNSFNESNVHPNVTSAIHTFSLRDTTQKTTTSRPSLDRIASRSELLRTPISSRVARSTSSQPQIYDNMPSSPITPPSPSSREFIDFGKNSKTRRTLEWACAAARFADRDPTSSSSSFCCTPSCTDPPSEISSGPITTAGAGNGHHRHHHHHHHHHSVMSASADVNKPCASRGRERERERTSATFHPHHHQHRPIHRSSSTRKDRERLSRSSSSLTLRGEGSLTSSSTTSRAMNVDSEETDTEQEDEDDDDHHEAITPPNTWGRGDIRWTTASSSSSSSTSISREGSSGIMSLTSAAIAAAAGMGREEGRGNNAYGMTTDTMMRNYAFASSSTFGDGALPKGVEDDAMFKAAIALCGLGRRM